MDNKPKKTLEESEKKKTKKIKIKIKKKKPKPIIYQSIEEQLTSCNEPTVRDTSFNDRVVLDNWVLNNRRQFIPFLNTFSQQVHIQEREFLKIWDNQQEKMVENIPFIQQKFVSDYLNDNTPYRGLLFYHGLGSGKSGASIMSIEGFLGKPIVILLPASLRKNYEDEIKRFGDIVYKKQYHWCFIKIKLSGNIKQDKSIYDRFNRQGINSIILKEIINKYNGIWMVDNSRDPNYEELSLVEREQIDTQIEKLYNYRYTFIHYNRGSSLFTHILETFYPNYIAIKMDVLGENIKNSKITHNDKLNLLEYIYNPENKLDNPFDNKVIVVDEVHNLISMMSGSGFNGQFLYEMLVRAKNCKIIFLSGTPVINHAYELGLLFNILNGYIETYTLKLNSDNWDSENLNTLLISSRLIDRIQIDSSLKTIQITRNPSGFITNINTDGKDVGVIKDNTNNISDDAFIHIVKSMLEDNGYSIEDVNIQHYNLFPDMLNTNSSNYSYLTLSKKFQDDSLEMFNSQYIDYNDFTIKDKSILLFQSKIVGLVSFYNEISGNDENGNALFPELIYATPDKTNSYMSDYQFSLYTKSRDIERELDERKNMKKNVATQVESNNPSLFRVFSRQSGLFVFPPTIKRPRRKDFRKKGRIQSNKQELFRMLKQICETIDNDEKKQKLIKSFKDVVDLDEEKKEIWETDMFSISEDNIEETKTMEETISNTADYLCKEHTGLFDEMTNDVPEIKTEKLYELELIKAISKLTPGNLLLNSENNYNLNVLSPKYVQMLQNIYSSEGLVFCYSQFRGSEGIEMFKRVLIYNGYSQLLVDTSYTIIRDDTIKLNDKVRYSINPEDEYKPNTKWNTGNISELLPNNQYKLQDNPKIYNRDDLHKCHFALWTGTENEEQRDIVKQIFNDTNNKWGQLCNILIASSSGSEGISLFNVRQVHIMEPYWNNIRINQVIGRARRIKSHIELPEDQQNVEVFMYTIKFTEEQKNGTWGEILNIEDLKSKKDDLPENMSFILNQKDISLEDINTKLVEVKRSISSIISDKDNMLTSDEALIDIADKKSKILNDFLRIIQEVAVDCKFNKDANIKSNPRLSILECVETLPGDGKYNYELKDTMEYQMGISKEQITKKEHYKTKRLSLKVRHKSIVKIIYFLVFIPDEYQKVSEYMKTNTLTSIPIYDYYIYYNLNYEQNQHTIKNRVEIGNISMNIQHKMKTNITSDQFKINTDKYVEIQDLINKHHMNNPPNKDFDIIEWSQEIIKLQKPKISTSTIEIETEYIEDIGQSIQEKWKCLICNDQQEYTDDIDICPICGIGTKQMWQVVSKTHENLQSLKKGDGNIQKTSII